MGGLLEQMGASMRARKRWLSRSLVLLVAAGCSHGSGATHQERLERTSTTDPGVRTKGGDSLTTRIPVLISQGRLQEAEALLEKAVIGGLIAHETERHLQERIERLKQQRNTKPRRLPPPIRSEELEPGKPPHQRRDCRTELPDHPICRALPEEYAFHSAQQALAAMKQRLGAKNLVLHNPDPTRSGPCQWVGRHYNVRMNGERAGSIVCCPCCVESEPASLLWEKCRIVW